MEAKTIPQQRAKRLEGQWTRKLQQQAKNWQLAKADGRYQTDQGVPVVRRHKRSMTKRSAMRAI